MASETTHPSQLINSSFVNQTTTFWHKSGFLGVLPPFTGEGVLFWVLTFPGDIVFKALITVSCNCLFTGLSSSLDHENLGDHVLVFFFSLFSSLVPSTAPGTKLTYNRITYLNKRINFRLNLSYTLLT